MFDWKKILFQNLRSSLAMAITGVHMYCYSMEKNSILKYRINLDNAEIAITIIISHYYVNKVIVVKDRK